MIIRRDGIVYFVFDYTQKYFWYHFSIKHINTSSKVEKQWREIYNLTSLKKQRNIRQPMGKVFLMRLSSEDVRDFPVLHFLAVIISFSRFKICFVISTPIKNVLLVNSFLFTGRHFIFYHEVTHVVFLLNLTHV